MSENDFTKLVKEMRQGQKDYFKTRNFRCLEKARTLESQVDHEIKNRENPTLGL